MKTPSSYLTIGLVAVAVSSLPLAAQSKTNGSGGTNGEKINNTEETVGPRSFWQANLPGGSYTVALRNISSVSKHTYLISATLSVTEVVIDTNGNSLARFYYIIPVTEASGSNVAGNLTNRAKELLDHAGDRTGADANTAVEKEYPTTTHAKTVEFRVSDEGDLDKLYSSVRKAWINGKGVKFTIRN